MKAIIGFLLLIPLTIWGVGRIYNGIRYDMDCGGNLKRAADANTVQMAAKELDVVLAYLEKNGMTDGYTSVLWRTPAEDVAFWYNNIRSAREELNKVTDQTSQLERTNVLMKLRETLLDNGDKGMSVTDPSGISIFPHNTIWMFFGILSLVVSLIGTGFLVVAIDDF